MNAREGRDQAVREMKMLRDELRQQRWEDKLRYKQVYSTLIESIKQKPNKTQRTYFPKDEIKFELPTFEHNTLPDTLNVPKIKKTSELKSKSTLEKLSAEELNSQFSTKSLNSKKYKVGTEDGELEYMNFLETAEMSSNSGKGKRNEGIKMEDDFEGIVDLELDRDEDIRLGTADTVNMERVNFTNQKRLLKLNQIYERNHMISSRETQKRKFTNSVDQFLLNDTKRKQNIYNTPALSKPSSSKQQISHSHKLQYNF